MTACQVFYTAGGIKGKRILLHREANLVSLFSKSLQGVLKQVDSIFLFHTGYFLFFKLL